jgi:hypothetical protein
MFELEPAIDDWKRRFAQLDSVRGADVEELEVHLRDSILELASKGLTEEEAFGVAAGRLGDAPAVSREFEKINPGHAWVRRVFRWCASAPAFALLNIICFCVIAWMLASRIDDLERDVRPLRAALDGQVVLEQRAFSPGPGNFLLPLSHYESFGELVDAFESLVMNQYVADGSYGTEWVLENQRGEVLPKNSRSASLDDAGITAGAVLRVAVVKEGRVLPGDR